MTTPICAACSSGPSSTPASQPMPGQEARAGEGLDARERGLGGRGARGLRREATVDCYDEAGPVPVSVAAVDALDAGGVIAEGFAFAPVIENPLGSTSFAVVLDRILVDTELVTRQRGLARLRPPDTPRTSPLSPRR